MHYLPAAFLFIAVLALLVLAAPAIVPRLTERTVFEGLLAGVGALLGACQVVTWLVGSTIGLSFPLIFAVLAVLVAMAAVYHKSYAANLAWLRNGMGALGDLRGWELACALYLAAVFALTFVLTLAPPSGSDYDSLMYHLAVPQQYLREGRIVELAYDHHSYFPFGAEMLFTLGLWLEGPVLAKLFHWMMLPLSCLALIAIAGRHLTRRAGLFAAALFASIPVVQFEASTAYIDLALAAFTLLAFSAFFAWCETRSPRALLACGLFCGVCLGTKYLGVLTSGWLLLAIVAVMAKDRRVQPGPLAASCLLALAAGGGWYVRNALWTGNPVFPFAYDIFGGRGWTAEMAAAYMADQKQFGMGRSLSDLLWLPWRLSMAPLNVALDAAGSLQGGRGYWPFSETIVTGGTGAFDTRGMLAQAVLGPALLAFTVPLLFMRRKPPAVGFALWSMLFFFVFWAATGQYLRYLVPAFAVLCLAAGWGVHRYLERTALLKWSTAVALPLWAVFAPYYVYAASAPTMPVALGARAPEEYLMRTFGGYDAMKWASENSPPEARFAVIGEPRCFYLQRDYFWADAMHNTLIDYASICSGAGLVKALRDLGATHLLFNSEPERNGGAGGAPPFLQEAASAGLLKALYSSRGYVVYELAEAAQ